jgi:hypothetical protein
MRPSAREILVPTSSANAKEILVTANSATSIRIEAREQLVSCSEERGTDDSPSLVVDRQIFKTLSAAAAKSPRRHLDELSRTVWGALAAGRITENDAQRLAEQIEDRRGSKAARLARTSAKHGLTGQELERFDGAVRFMEWKCPPRSRLWWTTVSKDSSRATIADVQKRTTRLQRRHGLPPYNVTAFETRGGLHAHIAFIGNRDIAQRLQCSASFGALIKVAPISDAVGLTKGYLAKERTSQAGYGREHRLGGRLRGSHRLDGGGDRVRLSRELERDAVEAGYVGSWQHTNARRSAERKPYRLRRLRTKKALRIAGQLPLLPEIERPVSRLREFGAGFVPPAVAVEMEFRRRRLGLSQRQYAAMLGISQGQLANALRGHDPISAFAVNRAREIRST